MANVSSGAIDYTSRDFLAIREDLITATAARLPEWNSQDPNDYLRILLEAFAFVGDLNNYYIDRIANEANLSTATQRQSLLNIARTFGYFPNGPLAASTTLQLGNNSNTDVLIPTGTQFSGSFVSGGVVVTSVFEATADVIVTANHTAAVEAVEGSTIRGSAVLQGNGGPIGALLYRSDGRSSSDGSPEQVFVIPQSPVIEDSVQVWIHPVPGTNETLADGLQYSEVTNLVDASPTDFAFSILRGTDDSARILFGDGVSGYVPPSGYQVRAVYRVGGGTASNVPAWTINTVGGTPTGDLLPSTITVTQPVSATGGVDAESDDSIRTNAPRMLALRSRAVSLDDFESIALRRAGVSRARAVGSALSNVVCYVSPTTGVADHQPGFSAAEGSLADVAVTSGLATVTTNVDHGLHPGNVVNIAGAGRPFDGTWALADGTSASTLLFEITWSDIATTSTSYASFYATGAETQGFTDIRAATTDILRAAAPAGTGVSVAAPVYTDIAVRVTVQLMSNVRQSIVKRAVETTVLDGLNVMDIGFGATIQDFAISSAIINAVDGVRAVDVTTLARGAVYTTDSAIALANSMVDPQPESRNSSLTAAPYELFRLLPRNLNVSLVGGIPDL